MLWKYSTKNVKDESITSSAISDIQLNLSVTIIFTIVNELITKYINTVQNNLYNHFQICMTVSFSATYVVAM